MEAILLVKLLMLSFKFANTLLSLPKALIASKSKINHTAFLRNIGKRVFKDHPRDPKLVAVVDRWSLSRGISML
jgi:hypothetical protein